MFSIPTPLLTMPGAGAEQRQPMGETRKPARGSPAEVAAQSVDRGNWMIFCVKSHPVFLFLDQS